MVQAVEQVQGPRVARAWRELKGLTATWRAKGETIALVPTMGALHAGHLSLVECGRERADRVVVSIFVNPTQFGPEEDFARYPRQEQADVDLLAAAGADLVYLPSVEEMYRPGAATTVTVSGVSEGLEGTFRPTHFAGVATIVTKLLGQVRPQFGIFGQKDYQQLLVVRQLARDLYLDAEIIGAPTKREADGLAMSSRNAYLSPAERAAAAALPAALTRAAAEIRGGGDPAQACAEAAAALEAAGFSQVQYLSLADGETLKPMTTLDRPARLLAAAIIGKTRLIDNVAV